MTDRPLKPSMPLFEPMARARRLDPETSHIAAEEANATGRAKVQRTSCLAAVTKYPGHTAAEIAKLINMERHVPSRRLPELRDAGFVVNGDNRDCLVTGNPSMTWWPEGGNP